MEVLIDTLTISNVLHLCQNQQILLSSSIHLLENTFATVFPSDKLADSEGIEPSPFEPKSNVLPLYYESKFKLAESEGFEPPEAFTSAVFKTAAINQLDQLSIKNGSSD